MKKIITFCLTLLSLSLCATPYPRTIITLYDSDSKEDIFYTNVHQFAEMPLNHLGYKVEYHDIQKELPDLSERDDVIGVLTWFTDAPQSLNPESFIQWAKKTMDEGKKYVVMGNPGFYTDPKAIPHHMHNDFWNKLGLYAADSWIHDDYEVEILSMDPKMVNFEHAFLTIKPDYNIIKAVDSNVTSYLTFRVKDEPDLDSVLITTGPHGGYVAESYAVYQDVVDKRDVRKWYLNPFYFFQRVFDQNNIPKPDTTTLAGRRIFYSQIDGDGWLNQTEITSYQHKNMLCSDIMYQEILSAYSELPFTVGLIAAELSSDWVGTTKSQETAKKTLKLANVETGCHTLTHPLDWQFYEEEGTFDENAYHEILTKNKRTLSIWNKLKQFLNKTFGFSKTSISAPLKPFTSQRKKTLLASGYTWPRTYRQHPFEIHKEIQDAISIINQVAPEHNQVAIYLWSGNHLPFPKAVSLTREAGIRNINGGNTVFDNTHDSYTWVKPLGRQSGDQFQVYASSSPETTYTDDWRDNFFAYNLLPATFINTEIPRRVKPMNLYFHFYSAQKMASLNSLKQNLSYVRTQEIIPIKASEFSAIVDGFLTTRITPLSKNQWRIDNRGKLNTIRFDDTNHCCVNIPASKGVIGQRNYNNSLYVYLDESETAPILTIEKEKNTTHPYLIESRWKVWDIHYTPRLSFHAQGYGPGDMQWQMPSSGRYKISVTYANGIDYSIEKETINNTLTFTLDANGMEPVQISMEKINA